MIRGGNCPPWQEYIPIRYEWSEAYGKVIGDRAFPKIDPHRPREWLEIVDGDRITMRTQRPLHRLYGVLKPWEKVYKARRRNLSSPLHDVTRKLVYGRLR